MSIEEALNHLLLEIKKNGFVYEKDFRSDPNLQKIIEPSDIDDLIKVLDGDKYIQLRHRERDINHKIANVLAYSLSEKGFAFISTGGYINNKLILESALKSLEISKTTKKWTVINTIAVIIATIIAIATLILLIIHS